MSGVSLSLYRKRMLPKICYTDMPLNNLNTSILKFKCSLSNFSRNFRVTEALFFMVKNGAPKLFRRLLKPRQNFHYWSSYLSLWLKIKKSLPYLKGAYRDFYPKVLGKVGHAKNLLPNVQDVNKHCVFNWKYSVFDIPVRTHNRRTFICAKHLVTKHLLGVEW